MTVKLAVIGGTGVYDPTILNNIRDEEIGTRYGTIRLKVGEYAGKEVAFLPRHGDKHTVPPHMINYRANIAGLQELGVEKILATAAVGSLNREMAPGDFVIVDQFLDLTKNRPSTFYDGENGVIHTDFTDPYCAEVRQYLQKASQGLSYRAHNRGTYVCTEGPRFETPAEIRMYHRLAGDLVGMTSVPEVVLAREAGICYATVALVTNFAAGISLNSLSHAEVVEAMQQNTERLKELILQTIEILPAERPCACGNAVAAL